MLGLVRLLASIVWLITEISLFYIYHRIIEPVKNKRSCLGFETASSQRTPTLYVQRFLLHPKNKRQNKNHDYGPGKINRQVFSNSYFNLLQRFAFYVNQEQVKCYLNQVYEYQHI
jgi:hypothetical protein